MSRKKRDLQEQDIEFMDLEDENSEDTRQDGREDGYPEDHEQDGWGDEYPEDYEQDGWEDGYPEDYEEDDYEEDDWEDEYPEDYEEDSWDDEDELEPVKPWVMALVFIGLVVLAAVICAILWRFTHSDVPGSGPSGDGVVTEGGEAAGSGGASALPGEQVPGSADDARDDGGAGGGMDQPEDSATDPGTQQPVSTSEEEDTSVVLEPENGDTSMSFNPVEESVTPKDLVNLRSVPSTADENTIVTQISNGDVLSRTGVNPDTGWSQIDYDGQTLYAVTQYLTTDLSYKTPVKPSDPNRVNTISGRVIIFADCDDNVTPKEYVNLRTEPSTTEGDATVRCQVRSGEVVHRTGYSADSGWSRVEYNGEVLYVVTSLMLAQ